MVKAAIIYFSGTQNTKFVAYNMKKQLEKNNISTDLINIEKDTMLPSNYKYIIIGGPIYVDLYPDMLVKYIRKNLYGYTGQCMLFCTQSSNKPPSAFQDVLNRASFLNIKYCEFIQMPNNFYNFMFKKTSKEEQDKRVEAAINLSRKSIDEFLNGNEKIYHTNFLKVDFVKAVYKMFYPYIAKKLTKNIDVDLKKCNHCGMCEIRCPRRSIHVTDKVNFNDKCLLCQRCMNSCPRNAFLYKNKVYDKYQPNFKKGL
ncbi:MAG: EFR1 family ferrodoxin [Clostridium sp.]|nr:EFR1 family ferrodoxin [Clostridium sp.]